MSDEGSTRVKKAKATVVKWLTKPLVGKDVAVVAAPFVSRHDMLDVPSVTCKNEDIHCKPQFQKRHARQV